MMTPWPVPTVHDEKDIAGMQHLAIRQLLYREVIIGQVISISTI